ncbi:MAG: filamentous hemagglutinin N-terminal domain-containing protein [Waterburya sp.]
MKLKATRLFNKQQLVRVGKNWCLSTILFFTLPIALVEAQIIPDESLSTNTEQQGENRLNINGGEREGNNLFHSFEEFSIPEGLEAVFENAPDIENIFTRITGEEASAINGILRTQGGANFFLVNPNGIVFGENAQLDVGGSFIATTADSIQFEDGTEFAANSAENKPILTVSVPIGLQFDENSGAITVNGSGNQISRQGQLGQTPYLRSRTSGLSVPSGETLALVGKGLNFNSGAIVTEGGQVKIGSVNSGIVNLQENENGWILGYEEIAAFEDVNFTQNALIDPSGADSSSIEVYGKDINLTNNSILLIQNDETTSTGSVNINASDFLNINKKSSITTETVGQEEASSISISTGNLLVENGGGIVTGAFDTGRSGDIEISVAKKLQIINAASTATAAGIVSFTDGTGDAGDISVTAQELKASQGSSITSATVGIGNSGNLNINANLIELEGTTKANETFTFIGSVSVGQGKGGNVSLNTENLRILNGAAISSDSSSDANAGNIKIDASDSVEVSGVDSNTETQSSINSSITIQDNEALREASGLPSIPNGNAGNITINTPILNVNQGGTVSVKNEGSGEGGTILIDANDLNLEKSGNINAETASGLGGNINIDADSLQLDENSSVTATANNNGDGGNITINTNTLIAKKNSQVTANAFNGRGGNIDINAEGLFLFDSPQNIFSASSELGIDGTIQINTPDIDLQRELEQSELELPTTEETIAGSCLARSNQQGSFTVNNGTGLPKSPNSNYSDIDSTLTGISSLPTTAKQPKVTEEGDAYGKRSYRQQNTSMLPAERMVKTENGRVFLVAAPQEPESLFCPKN